MNDTRLATTHVTIRVRGDMETDVYSNSEGEGSVFLGGPACRLQLHGTPLDLRRFAKAIDDGAMELERLLADAEAAA
jgi:hypothetical protein